MINERIQAVERVIAELEAAHGGWANKDIYEKVGGNYAQLAAYLKARRAGEQAGTVAVEEAEPPTVGEQWQAARAAYAAASNRLAGLHALGQVQLLSEQEELEQVRLERRLANLQPILTRLEREAAHEQGRIDIEAVLTTWAPLVEQKRLAYEHFLASIVALRQAFFALLAVHKRPEQALLPLPRVVQQGLNFPDAGSMQANLVSRMKDAMGWSMVLGPPEPVALPNLAALLDVDPGSRPLAPRAVM